MSRPIAVLNLSRRVKVAIATAQAIAKAIAANPSYFPSPIPSLATFQADVDALNSAELTVLARTKGAAEFRDAKLKVVRADLETLRTYVQSAADANPPNAEAIVEASGMTLRKVTLHDKPPLAAKQGSVSGTVNLAAKSVARRAAYEWQYSTDQKTWTSLPPTLQAKTGVSGLTVGTVYYFRFRALTRTGEGDFGQVVSLLVS